MLWWMGGMMRGFSSCTSIMTLVVENVSQQPLFSSNYLGLFGGRAHPHVVVGFGLRGFSAAIQLCLKAADSTARKGLHSCYNSFWCLGSYIFSSIGDLVTTTHYWKNTTLGHSEILLVTLETCYKSEESAKDLWKIVRFWENFQIFNR